MKKPISEDAPINSVASGGVSLPATKKNILTRLLRRKSLPEESFGRKGTIGAKTPKTTRRLTSTLDQIKKAVGKNHPLNKPFHNPYAKNPIPSLIDLKTEEVGKKFGLMVPYTGKNDQVKWRRLPDASFYTFGSAESYGKKYHTGKHGEIRFKVVSLKEAFEGPVIHPHQTLYVNRPLMNVHEVKEWASQNGFELIADPHVTICLSRKPVDWSVIAPDPVREVVISHVEPKIIELDARNGKTAYALEFHSDELQKRFAYFLAKGASHDFPTFRAHMTIAYERKHRYRHQDIPYTGKLIFGGEIFNPVNPKYL